MQTMWRRKRRPGPLYNKMQRSRNKRNYNLIEKDIRDPEQKMRKLVYRNGRHQEIGRQIKDLWSLRKELMNKLIKDPNNNTHKRGQGSVTSINSPQ